MSVCLSFCLSVSSSVGLSVCLSVYMPVCLSVRLSACLFLCLSVCRPGNLQPKEKQDQAEEMPMKVGVVSEGGMVSKEEIALKEMKEGESAGLNAL